MRKRFGALILTGYVEQKKSHVYGSEVECSRCKKMVQLLTFSFDGAMDIGVCACPWTYWSFDEKKSIIRRVTSDSCRERKRT